MKASRLLPPLALLLLTACGTLQIGIDRTPAVLPSFTLPVPTDTATAVLSPTTQPSPTATLTTPTATNTSPPPTAIPPTVPPLPTTSGQTVKIFLIALEDNGRSGTPVGCGDSAVPITVTIPRTQGVLRAALEKLLSARQQFYGEAGYYNALYQSNLQLESVTIEQGEAIIHLSGTIMLGGVCDAPRVQAQLEQTALQFSTVNEVTVFVNGMPLEEILSQK